LFLYVFRCLFYWLLNTLWYLQTFHGMSFHTHLISLKTQ
jgi:hypothetical protein